VGKSSFLKVICIVFVFCVMTAIASQAQTLNTLYSFCTQSGCTDGSFPQSGPVQGIDGNFYGTVPYGGANNNTSNCQNIGCGTIFKIAPAGKLTTLYSFCSLTNCPDGNNPVASLVLATDGNFYGTTGYGGTGSNCPLDEFTGGCGTVFRITAGGKLTTLYSFCSLTNCADGSQPQASLIQATDGSLYGTAEFGGANGKGTVFKITPSGTLTTLYSFCAVGTCDDGAQPTVGLVQATNGDLYGTTHGGGAHNKGTVFKITAGGKLTTLHNFHSIPDGEIPSGLVQASNGNLYGTTFSGGDGGGTVFSITLGGALTTLYTFCAQSGCPDGANPQHGVVPATDGNLYGTTQGGGVHYGGTVFKITPSGTLTTLYSFCEQSGCSDGEMPVGLVQATDGNFYGTTYTGGANGDGTVFSLSVGLGPFVKTVSAAGKVGAKVIILGNNLTGATSVAFNGTTAPLLKVTASAIETSVPTGATTGTVTVTTASGTLDSNVAFQVLP
jgi:uncharacterized repeat protein (TIGR03803 family)